MARHKKLSHSTMSSILDGVHKTLTDHNVTQPVQVRFAAAAGGLCWEYRLVTDEEGNPVYRMVQVPCE